MNDENTIHNWIRVDEIMPESDIRVSLLINGSARHWGHFDNNQNVWKDDEGKEIKLPVTHWQHAGAYLGNLR